VFITTALPPLRPGDGSPSREASLSAGDHRVGCSIVPRFCAAARRQTPTMGTRCRRTQETSG